MSYTIEIYLEQTPNPQSIKFVTNRILISNSYQLSREELSNSKSLLINDIMSKFDWINNVFISHNFITITKSDSCDWFEYYDEIKNFLKMYLQNDFEIVEKSYLDTLINNDKKDYSTEGKIKDIINKYIKPSVSNDGGNIEFHSFDATSGKLLLSMQGSCKGCPSANVTLKSGIEGIMKKMIPEVCVVESI